MWRLRRSLRLPGTPPIVPPCLFRHKRKARLPAAKRTKPFALYLKKTVPYFIAKRWTAHFRTKAIFGALRSASRSMTKRAACCKNVIMPTASLPARQILTMQTTSFCAFGGKKTKSALTSKTRTARRSINFISAPASPMCNTPYPDGNDMGERNGTWQEKNGQIFIDGAFLCTLPQRTPAPDSCAVFAGACTAAQTELL